MVFTKHTPTSTSTQKVFDNRIVLSDFFEQQYTVGIVHRTVFHLLTTLPALSEITNHFELILGQLVFLIYFDGNASVMMVSPVIPTMALEGLVITFGEGAVTGAVTSGC